MKGDPSCHIYTQKGKQRYDIMRWDSTIMRCNECGQLVTWKEAVETNDGACSCGGNLDISVAEEPFEYKHD